MTRLIDADALIEAMTKFSNAIGEDMTHGIFYAHIAPTVEILTADEMLTIRIHMGAIKERLCNQKRWSEAEDYQIICDKLDKILEMDKDE